MTGAGEISGTLTAGSYRLGRALGGEGRVHEARHDALGGRFAIKVFGEVEPRAFQRGAQRASVLRHPGIAKVVDYGSAPAGAFVVMEWIQGRSLAAMLAEGGSLAPDAVARIIDSVALGLQAAHRQGLAHGHLAPDRILVLGPGAANDDETPGAEHTKILGFGLGPGDALRPGIHITEVTPYTAPEQLAEQLSNDASPVADQFALAAIAYELLAGVAPAGDAALRQPPRALREYDPTLNVIVDDVIQRALSIDPGARWADVYTFSKRLREAIDAEGTLEEKTRLAPLPLTVTRPAFTPTPIDIHIPPVIASVDVDLRTPAPKRLELHALELPAHRLPVQGEIAMNPRPTRPSQTFHGGVQLPGQVPQVRPQGRPQGRPQTRPPGQPHYGIRPTPTFSFTDDPVAGPLYKPRRARSGGGLGLAVLVVAAGVGGYLAVQTRVWQEAEPLLARARVLASSLRTLAPGASPEASPPAPSAPSGAGPTATTAGGSAAAAPPSSGTSTAASPTTTTTTTAAAPAVHPEVVPIAPAPPARSAAGHASHTAHHAASAHHPREHQARARASRSTLSDEAAAEEALLAPPSGR